MNYTVHVKANCPGRITKQVNVISVLILPVFVFYWLRMHLLPEEEVSRKSKQRKHYEDKPRQHKSLFISNVWDAIVKVDFQENLIVKL